MAKGSNAQPKVVEFTIPTFLPVEQLFSLDDQKRKIVFVKNGQKVIKNCQDPKTNAFGLSNSINDPESQGGVVRLTFKGTSCLAYVVIDLQNPQQVRWAQTQKTKRRLVEEKFIGEAAYEQEEQVQVLYT